MLGAAIGFPLFGLILVKRIYNTGKITISGAIAEKYGNSTKNIISLIMIYALLLVNVGNYVSGAAAISTVLKVNLPVAAFITAIVSTFYFAFGGMKGVASGHHVTQRVEIRRSADHSGFCPVQNRRLLADDGEDAGLLLDMGWQHWCWHDLRPRLIGTIGSIFAPSLSFRPLAQPKTFGQRNAPPWIAFFFCLPIAFAIAIIGVAAKYLHPEINSLYALPVFLQDMNPWLAGLVTTSLVASIFVSVSTVALGHCLAGGEGFLRTMAQPNAGPGNSEPHAGRR